MITRDILPSELSTSGEIMAVGTGAGPCGYFYRVGKGRTSDLAFTWRDRRLAIRTVVFPLAEGWPTEREVAAIITKYRPEMLDAAKD